MAPRTPRAAASAAHQYVMTGNPTWEELKEIVQQTDFPGGHRGAPQVYGEDPSYDDDTWADTLGMVSGLTPDQRDELRALALS